MVVLRNVTKIIGSSPYFYSKKAEPEGVTFGYFDVTMTKSEKSLLLHTLFSCLTKELQHEGEAKMKVKSMGFFFFCFKNGICGYNLTMCFKLYKRKQHLFTFSVA